MANKKRNDQIIFEHKRINDFIDKILDQDLSEVELLEEIDKLEEMGDEVLPVLISRLSQKDYRNQNFVILALKEIDYPNKKEALEAVIDDETSTDHKKVSAANILQNLGYPQDFEELSEHLHNPHQMLLSTLENMIESLEQDTAVIQMVNTLRVMDTESVVNLIENLKQFSDIRVNRLFIPMLTDDRSEIQLNLIKYLKDFWSEELLMPLKYVSESAEDPAVRKEARMVYFNTKMKVDNIGVQKSTTQKIEPLHKCIVSNIDGDGGQIVSITRRKKSGKLKLFNIFFNDRYGIKDCLGVDTLTQKEHNSMFGKMLLSGVFFYPVSTAFANDCVSTGLDISIDKGNPLPDDIFIWHYLLYDDKDYSDQEKEYQELDHEEIGQHPEYFRDCLQLLDLDEFESWFIEIPKYAQKRYISDVSRAKKSRGKARNDAMEQIVSTVVEEFITKNLKDKIRQRLLRQAPLLYMFHGTEESGWAIAAAEKLKDESEVAPNEHPLLREMAILGLSKFVEGI